VSTQLLELTLYVYLSVLAHELGHVLTAWYGGYWVSAWGLGCGKPWLRLRWGSTVFYLSPRRPLQGLTFAFPRHAPPSRHAELILLCGGILAHLGLIAVALLTLALQPASWPIKLAWVNVAFLVMALAPLDIQLSSTKLESDFQRIQRCLGLRPNQPPRLAEQHALFHRCIAHLEAVGDPIGVMCYRTELAQLELELGQTMAARELLEPSMPDLPPYWAVQHQLALGLLAAAEGHFEAACRHFAAAEPRTSGDQVLAAHVTLTACTTKLQLSQSVSSHELAAIETKLTSLTTAGHADLAAAQARCLAHVALLRDAPHEAMRLLADLDRADSAAAILAGRIAERLGQHSIARQHYRRALADVLQAMHGLSDRERRRGYLIQHGGLFERLVEQGLPTEVRHAIEAGSTEQAIEASSTQPAHLRQPINELALYLAGLGQLLMLAIWVSHICGIPIPDPTHGLLMAELAGALGFAALATGLVGAVLNPWQPRAWIAMGMGLTIVGLTLVWIPYLASLTT
jgi:tetratricopeptide (TPR) repeat protein